MGARLYERQDRDSVGWHYTILPFLEQHDLYVSGHPNALGGVDHSLANLLPVEYICPSAEPPTDDPNDIESANYVGVAGSGTSRFPSTLLEGIYGPVYTDGVLHVAGRVAVGDISDGSSNTLMIGERSYFNRGEDWTFGSYWLDFSGNLEPDLLQVGACKHLVYSINTAENGRAYYKQDTKAPLPLRTILNNDLPFGSLHPGGASFAFADGSVHFFDEQTDLNILRELASYNGGETNRWRP
jgi:prepilin-type processing-associated H-X9-DG protein